MVPDRRLIHALMILLVSGQVLAEGFVGQWRVTKVEMPENYYGEIRYPAYFEIIEQAGELSGRYQDQHAFVCDFPLIELVNDGNELLLMNCGSTKHGESWAPLHKVKSIEGKLLGSVVTDTQQFMWHAEPVDNLPFSESATRE